MSLTGLEVEKFVLKVSDATPAPGGGSVAALAGGLGAALCRMVARLTLGKEKHRDVREEMQEISDSASEVLSRSLELVDRDTEAYASVTSAFRLPKDTPELTAVRRESIQAATREATLVPMETLRAMSELIRMAEAAIEKGNPNCLSDAAVGVQLIRTAVMGAVYNIRINLLGISDEAFSSRIEGEMISLQREILPVIAKLEERIEKLLSR